MICLPPITTPSTPPASTEAPPPCEITVASGDWALSEVDEQFHMRNILYDACDHFSYQPVSANYWLAPAQTRASIILDLGCSRVIEGLTMKNTRNAHQNDRGLDQFTIAISNSTGGPWRTVLEGELPDVRNSSCNVPLVNFTLPEELSQEARTGRALKLQVVSWYGVGAGLQYLEVHTQQPADLGAGEIVGLSLLVVVLVGLLGFAWTRREKVRGNDRYERVKKYMRQQSRVTLVSQQKEDDVVDVDLH